MKERHKHPVDERMLSRQEVRRVTCFVAGQQQYPRIDVWSRCAAAKGGRRDLRFGKVAQPFAFTRTAVCPNVGMIVFDGYVDGRCDPRAVSFPRLKRDGLLVEELLERIERLLLSHCYWLCSIIPRKLPIGCESA